MTMRPLDRERVEREACARERGLLGRLLVGAAEPARARRARRARSRARSSRRGTARRGPVSAGERLGVDAGRSRARPRAARPSASTSSITLGDRALGVRCSRSPARRTSRRALDDGVLEAADVVEPVEVLVASPASRRSRRRGRGSASRCTYSPRSRGPRGRRATPSMRRGSIPGTRWTPSSTIDQPSVSARSIAASTPTSTFRVWSRKPRSVGSPVSASATDVVRPRSSSSAPRA